LFGAADREVYGTAAFYGALSRQIAETGVWNPIMHGDVPYVLKPPLQLWLAALAMKVLGPSPLAATLVSRLFGLGCIVLMAALGRRLYGRTAGYFAALILVTNTTFIENATTFRVETALMFGLLLSLWAYFSPRGRWRPAVFYLGVIVAVLSKGVPGLLPVIVAVLHAALSGRLAWPWRDEARPWVAWSVLLALPAWWYLDQYLRFSAWLIDQIVADATRTEVGTLAQRLASGLHTYVVKPMERYLPFSPFMAWGLVHVAREAVPGSQASARYQALSRTFLAWFVVLLVVLVFKGTYRTRYLIMVLPVLSLLGGRELARLVKARITARLSAGLSVLLIAAVLVAGSVHASRYDIDTMARVEEMRRLVDARLPGPAAPLPVLLANGANFHGHGTQQSLIDWAGFYLGRPVQAVREGDGVSAGTLYLVQVRAFEELSGRMPLEALVKTRFMVLAEVAGDQ